MKIAILGTRGIPNNHGGFEQFAEYLSQFLVTKGHQVYVYNSHTHPYQSKIWNGVHIIHKRDPENKTGTMGQFIYDFNCIRDCHKRNFDIILQLGYTSSSIWGWMLPKKATIVTNMDGLEWKRSKYAKPVRKFLKVAEKLAVDTSDYLISDSIGIKNYIKERYNLDSEFIPYGANLFDRPEVSVLREYGIEEYQYNMLIARLEPENNIEVILEGVASSQDGKPFVVIGKHETKYGEYLKNKFKSVEKIRFLGGIYNQNHLENLRYFSNLYFHGHSVGGTNPSLLEAMASSSLIIAHDNIFNKSILGEDAIYFQNSKDIVPLFNLIRDKHIEKIKNNIEKIDKIYSWPLINAQYESFISECLELEKR